MIASSQSQLRKKNNCSVKLQGGLLDHNPREVLVENSCKCVLLNDKKQVPHKILFILLDNRQNKKIWKHGNRKKQNLGKKIREIGWVALITAHQGSFMVLYVWEVLVRKNLTIFEGPQHPCFDRFCISIWWSFSKIETKNFNSDSCFFKLVKLGMISPAAHFPNFLQIGRSQIIAAIIHVRYSGKRFAKLRDIF